MTAGRRKGQLVGPIRGFREKENGTGAWLYLARLDAALTIDQLAEKSKVSRRTIMRIEAGRDASTLRRGEYERRAIERRLRAALGLVDKI